MLQALVADDSGNQILVWADIMVVPGIGRNLFSVTTAAKKDIVTIFDYENPRPERINVTVPLRNESGNLYLFVLNLSVDGYGAKELAMDAVANAQVWHRRLGHLYVPLSGATSPAEPLPGTAGRPSSGGASPPIGRGASPKAGRLSPVPVPTTARRGAAMRKNRIPQPTGAVTRCIPQRRRRRGCFSQHGARLRDQRQSRSSFRPDA